MQFSLVATIVILTYFFFSWFCYLCGTAGAGVKVFLAVSAFIASALSLLFVLWLILGIVCLAIRIDKRS